MSKPDPAGGSLESILASIRRSLAEQPSESQSEAPAPESDDARAPRRHGLTQRLAGTTSEFSAGDRNQAHDDLSDLLESPVGPAPAPAASPSTPPAAGKPETERQTSESDPLWFLSRRDEAAAQQGGQGSFGGGREAAKPSAPPAEPKLTRPEVLRASMPPFFGSSSDGASVTSSEPSETSSRSAPDSAQPAQGKATSPVPGASNLAHEVSLVAAAAETAAARPAPSAPVISALNGKAPDESHAASPGGSGPAEAHSNRALESAVLELLKPMLRQWLDENMPRLVAEALGDDKGRLPLGDNKTKNM